MVQFFMIGPNPGLKDGAERVLPARGGGVTSIIGSSLLPFQYLASKRGLRPFSSIKIHQLSTDVWQKRMRALWAIAI